MHTLYCSMCIRNLREYWKFEDQEIHRRSLLIHFPPLYHLWRISCLSRQPELEFLKSLWGLGTEEEEGYCTSPSGYIGWRNSFLGINSGAPYTFKNTGSEYIVTPFRVCGGKNRFFSHSIHVAKQGVSICNWTQINKSKTIRSITVRKIYWAHWKDSLPKIRNKYSLKSSCTASVPVPTFMLLWEMFILFPWSACVICCKINRWTDRGNI